jgi:pimeloyl-ACP methyl ester carboxylesterase
LRAECGRRAVLLLGLLSVLAHGCASTQAQLLPRPVPGITVPATVFVADGAGDFQITSRTLRSVSQADGYPLRIVTAHWSHGYLRIIADHVCYNYARMQGKKLADEVLDYRTQNPHTPIYLVGHSAGSAVIMAALENLPPGVVDRALLLSPSLSSSYDLRPALAAVGRGLHVFYSTHDYWYLGLVTNLLGSSDRHWSDSSGRYGFRVPCQGDNTGLYGKLVQRPWQPADMQLGNLGGHYGNYQLEFLRTYIIPLLQPTPHAPH